MQHLARHVHYADGRPENGKITDRQILNIACAEALNSSLSGVLDKRGPPMLTPAWLAILLSRVVTAAPVSTINRVGWPLSTAGTSR